MASFKMDMSLFSLFLFCSHLSKVICLILISYLGPATSLELTHVRFIAAKRGSTIYFHCIPDAKAKWYKTSENGKEQELTNNSRIHLAVNDSRMTMRIKKIEGTDSGIYFCARNISYGCCGTELKVMGEFLIFYIDLLSNSLLPMFHMWVSEQSSGTSPPESPFFF